jgi:hypothetical protein
MVRDKSNRSGSKVAETKGDDVGGESFSRKKQSMWNGTAWQTLLDMNVNELASKSNLPFTRENQSMPKITGRINFLTTKKIPDDEILSPSENSIQACDLTRELCCPVAPWTKVDATGSVGILTLAERISNRSSLMHVTSLPESSRESKTSWCTVMTMCGSKDMFLDMGYVTSDCFLIGFIAVDARDLGVHVLRPFPD